MPRRARKSKRKAASEIGPFALKLGAIFPSAAQEPTERQWQAAWVNHRDALMDEFRSRRPGTRPWAFWEFDVDAPEVEPGVALAELRWLLEHGQVNRREGDAILAEERQLLERGHGDFDPHGALHKTQERAELVRESRKKRRRRR